MEVIEVIVLKKIFFILIFLILASSTCALYVSPKTSLPETQDCENNITVKLDISDISGSLVIETDLENAHIKVYPEPILYNRSNFKAIIKPSTDKISVYISGTTPKGYKERKVKVLGDKYLNLVIFDFNRIDNGTYHIEKAYYKIYDESGDTYMKSFNLRIPFLDKTLQNIKEINNSSVKNMLYHYIDIGLYHYVSNDLLPIFLNYNYNKINMLESKVYKMENTITYMSIIIIILAISIIVEYIFLKKKFNKEKELYGKRMYDRGYQEGIRRKNSDF